MQPTLEDLRRYAVTRSLFSPTTLEGAIARLGFVQADPIRAPARAQDLTLRHRVEGYRAGDLERRYAELGVEEDVFINYGFLPAAVHALMHPRAGMAGWSRGSRKRADALLAFVRERGEAHPREVDAHFAHGRTINYWGRTSRATTHLLERMHYAGLLRVTRRDGGIRIYAARAVNAARIDRAARDAQVDALVDVVVRQYAPLPAASLSMIVGRLRYAVPQWQRSLKDALGRAKRRLSRARVSGIEWYWPADELVSADAPQPAVRLLAPFDPLVWDRRRFELFWGWPYRFEAYTPAPRRTRGYYALPLLWRDEVIGWGNVSGDAAALSAQFGYVQSAPPRARAFARALDGELARLRAFLQPR
jgi:uncharacterized protein YcaQ